MFKIDYTTKLDLCKCDSELTLEIYSEGYEMFVSITCPICGKSWEQTSPIKLDKNAEVSSVRRTIECENDECGISEFQIRDRLGEKHSRNFELIEVDEFGREIYECKHCKQKTYSKIQIFPKIGKEMIYRRKRVFLEYIEPPEKAVITLLENIGNKKKGSIDWVPLSKLEEI